MVVSPSLGLRFLLHNQMILTLVDAHGRVGPMARQNLYGTPPPAIPQRKQFKPNRPNAKAMYERATTLPAPIPYWHLPSSSKQISDGNKFKQIIHNTITNSRT